MEFQNASVVCPDSVRPEASVIVPETMMGSSSPTSSNTWRTANSAALAFKVSNTVSIKIISTPPAISARVTSQYAASVLVLLVKTRPLKIQRAVQRLHAVVLLRHRGRIEGVGGNDIGARVEVG